MQIINIGSKLEVKGLHNAVSTFTVAGYNEAGYMKLVDTKDASVGMTIHPAHAERIRDNVNGDSGIKVIDCEALTDVVALLIESALPQPEAPKPAVIKTVAKTVKAGDKGPTKKEQAAALKAANPTLTRKEIIALFVKELNMTQAGASTYASYK